jgi:hypothetical protein
MMIIQKHSIFSFAPQRKTPLLINVSLSSDTLILSPHRDHPPSDSGLEYSVASRRPYLVESASLVLLAIVHAPVAVLGARYSRSRQLVYRRRELDQRPFWVEEEVG